MAADKTFMTPAQQRNYLNQLRQENAELYNLTGRPSNVGHDPWSTPVPNPRTSRSVDETIKGADKLRGPPKPPKAAVLRKVSATTAGAERPAQSQEQLFKASKSSARPEPRVKPATLRKPLPQTPSKLVNPNQRDQSSSAESTQSNTNTSDPHSRKVTLTVMNYDIPQFQVDAPDQESEITKGPGTISSPKLVNVIDHDATHKSHDRGTSANSAPQHVPRRRQRRLQIENALLADQVARGLCCANCYEPFGRGRVITANNKRYHPIHFTCYECGIPLEHVDFYVHDPESNDSDSDPVHNEVYCHFDYHEYFSPKCHVCETPVIRDGIRALKRVYHGEHFFCALCSHTFSRDAAGEIEFVERDDMPWHPKCYEEKFSEGFTCRKCRQKIAAGTQVITMGTGSYFHPDCFLCAHCKGSLEAGFYWSKDKEGICKPCKEREVKQEL